MLRTLAVFAMAFALVTSASAEPSRHRGGGWGGHGDRGYSWWKPWRPDPSPGASFWGGVIGGFLGAQSTRPGREGEDVEGDLEPWSKAWFGYCTKRYRSFNPETGEYLGYDGRYHFCK